MLFYSGAKLNLFLHILGLQDNYHLLESLIIFTELKDEVFIDVNSAVLEINFDTGNINDVVIDPENNTVHTAVNLLARYYNIKPYGKILIKKFIPVGGGLGGGSVNAATILRVLPKMWGMPPIPENDLMAMAKQIGMDVVVCLHGRSAFISGLGEIVEEVNYYEKLHIALAMPTKSLLTKDVYKKFDQSQCPVVESVRDKFFNSNDMFKLIEKSSNSLYNAAISISPEIVLVRRLLEQNKGCVMSRMTGSGSVCFGVYTSAEYASMATYTLRDKGYWACTTTSKTEPCYSIV